MSDEKISSALGIRQMSDIDEAEMHLPAQVAPPSDNPVAIVSADDGENLRDIESVRKNI